MSIIKRVISRLMFGKPDYSIKKGDLVISKYWSGDLVKVVDVDWALGAAAVELAPGKGIVVWPVAHLKKRSCDN